MSFNFHHEGGGTGIEAAAFAGDFIRSNTEAVVNVSKPAFCKACFLVIIFLCSVFFTVDVLIRFIFDALVFLFIHWYFLSKSTSLIFDV
jgi:hypothetical protein